jgi:hypothetical protein
MLAHRHTFFLLTEICLRSVSYASSACNGMDAIDRHEALRGPSVGIVPILVPFSMALAAVVASSMTGVGTICG